MTLRYHCMFNGKYELVLSDNTRAVQNFKPYKGDNIIIPIPQENIRKSEYDNIDLPEYDFSKKYIGKVDRVVWSMDMLNDDSYICNVYISNDSIPDNIAQTLNIKK